MNLVNNIKALCETKEWSIPSLEALLNFSRSSISKWDKNQPTISRVVQVADALGVTVDFLCKSEYYKEKDLMRLFVNNLIKKTREEILPWTLINNRMEEFNEIKNTSPLYERSNFDEDTDLLGRYAGMVIYSIVSDENIIYFIEQTIYIETMDDSYPIDAQYYYIALKEKDSERKDYIIREPKKEDMEELHKEIKIFCYDKPEQKKVDNFIKKFISQ